MSEEILSTADYTCLDEAAQELHRRGWKRAFSLREVLDKWVTFVDKVQRGYRMTIDDHTNDLSIRRWCEEARPLLTDPVEKAMDGHLAPLDARFRDATAESGKLPGSGRDHWWETRLPLVLCGELADDVARMGHRPTSSSG